MNTSDLMSQLRNALRSTDHVTIELLYKKYIIIPFKQETQQQ